MFGMTKNNVISVKSHPSFLGACQRKDEEVKIW